VRPQRGRDYEQQVEITLQEAYQGTTRIFEKDGRRLRAKIPAGVRDGTRIRIAGEGECGASGGEAGDLYLRVVVSPDRRFERQGDDLYVTVPLDLYTAVLGGKVEVSTPDGMLRLKIPPGTQNGQSFRLRGRGMPHLQDPKEQGDLYAKVDVRLPTDLSPKHKELFQELRRISEKGERP
jgi:curved DNA-binding protein